MKYRYRFSAKAERYFGRLERATQSRIVVRLRDLCEDPYSREHSKELRGRGGLRSSRVGTLRILYYVEEDVRVVAATDIGPRGDIYSGGAAG